MEADRLLRMYEKMLEIRRFEEAIADLYYKASYRAPRIYT